MNRIFLEKYFPASRAANIRKEIYGIKQYTGESLHESMLDAVSGGVFVDKTPVQARNLIENMTANSQQFGTNRSDLVPRRGNEVNVSSLEQQLIELISLVHQMAIGNGQNVKSVESMLQWDMQLTCVPHFKRDLLNKSMQQEDFLGHHSREIMILIRIHSIEETRESIQHLNTQMGQLETTFNRLEAQNSNSLPSQTVVNPKENVSAITLRSGRDLKVREEVVHTPVNNEEVEKEPVQNEEALRAPNTRRTVAVNQPEQTNAAQVPVTAPDVGHGSTSVDTLSGDENPMEKLLKRFQSFKPPTLQGTENFVDCENWLEDIEQLFESLDYTDDRRVRLVIHQLHGLAKNWWVATKRAFENRADETTAKQQQIPPPPRFDVGGSGSGKKNFFKGKSKQFKRTAKGFLIYVVDVLKASPKLADLPVDVLVQVDKLVFSDDFYVLDMKNNDMKSPILLGRSFLKTSKSVIDVNNGTLTMEFDGEIVMFNIFDTLKTPSCESVAINTIDVNNHLSQEHKEVVNEDKLKEFIEQPAKNSIAEIFLSDLQVPKTETKFPPGRSKGIPKKSKQKNHGTKITGKLRK
ncbi:uncharacterized protein [Henckelia pumila]|uniref:uncharacterized protein n=1 Tax=Henckelia pumila TaxID=405737 RepID=UPI003C6E3559